MRLGSALGTSAFRLTLLYTGVFAASMLAVLAFVYWQTAALIDRQAEQTIEAEVRGLAEQYQRRGLAGLIEVIRRRVDDRGNDGHVYMLTSSDLARLAGNLAHWPAEAEAAGDWLTLPMAKRDDGGAIVPGTIQARVFVLPGNFHLLVGRDMQERAIFRAIVLEALAWSSAGTLALGVLGGLLLSRRVLGKVEQVAATARRIVAGDLSQRVAGNGSGDEFDRLAAILNAMLDRIERLMAGMRLATDSLAHDLRRPLTRLKARTELALLAAPDAERDRQALADVLAQSDAALALFESLLRIAMAESGAAATELRPVDLAGLARDAADLYQPVAEDRGIVLTVATGPAAMIRGQTELLAQSVANLLDNAVRYTPAGGRIGLLVAAAGDGRVRLEVADSGPGIAAADRARVLERFVRLEEARSSAGAGLGLSLVAAVARLHGATLDLADNAPGLKVTLLFPAAPDTDAAGQAAAG